MVDAEARRRIHGQRPGRIAQRRARDLDLWKPPDDSGQPAEVRAVGLEGVHASARSDELGEEARLEPDVGADVDHDVAPTDGASNEGDLGRVLPPLEAEVEGPIQRPRVPEERAGERLDEDGRQRPPSSAATAGRPVTSISPSGRGKLMSDHLAGSMRTTARAKGARAGAIVSV